MLDDDESGVTVRLGPSPQIQVSEPTDAFAALAGELISYANPATKKRLSGELKKLYQGTDAGTKSTNDMEYSGYDIYQVITPPYNLDNLAKLYESSSSHYAAVRAKASNIVGLGYDLVEAMQVKFLIEEATEQKLAKMRKKIRKEKEKVLQWIDSCNQEDEFSETLTKVYVDYETTGMGYLEIGRKNTGEIGYIGHIPSTTMRMRKDRDGFVQMVSNRAVFFRNFGDTTTLDPINRDNQPNEIIQIKKYSPTNTYYGVPDIVSALGAVAGNEFSSRFNLEYFENKAVPRYIFLLKGSKMSEHHQKQLLDFFEAGLKGKSHRTMFIPLPTDNPDQKVDFEMKAIEAGVQDSSFDAYKRSNINEILMAHRVPLSKVSSGEGISLAVARDSDKTFKEQVCRPEQKIFEKKLNKIFQEITPIFVFKLNELTLTDEDTQSKIDERYLRMQTILPNEIRSRWGWSGLPSGDKPVELKPQQAADQRARGTRTRDAERSSNSPDVDGEGRATPGDGRADE